MRTTINKTPQLILITQAICAVKNVAPDILRGNGKRGRHHFEHTYFRRLYCYTAKKHVPKVVYEEIGEHINVKKAVVCIGVVHIERQLRKSLEVKSDIEQIDAILTEILAGKSQEE